MSIPRGSLVLCGDGGDPLHASRVDVGSEDGFGAGERREEEEGGGGEKERGAH